jgi:hypothetical protein
MKIHLRFLFFCFLVYVQLKKFSLIWRRHHCRWRAAKIRPMLSTQGLWAGRYLYCTTVVVTWDLLKARSIQSPLTTHKATCRIYSDPNPHGSISGNLWQKVLWFMKTKNMTKKSYAIFFYFDGNSLEIQPSELWSQFPQYLTKSR